MITVKIEINGKIIGEITAVNKGQKICEGEDEDYREYETSNKQKVYHNRKCGALLLSKKLLDCLSEEDLVKEGIRGLR